MSDRIQTLLQLALEEDIGTGDITSEAIFIDHPQPPLNTPPTPHLPGTKCLWTLDDRAYFKQPLIISNDRNRTQFKQARTYANFFRSGTSHEVA